MPLRLILHELSVCCGFASSITFPPTFFSSSSSSSSHSCIKLIRSTKHRLLCFLLCTILMVTTPVASVTGLRTSKSDPATYRLMMSKVNSRPVDCPSKCNCIWRNDKTVVDCSSANLSDLPIGTRSDVQVFILNNNHIKELKSKIFQSTGLINLQKIHLSNCTLRVIARDAFGSLSNLVELDLSRNRIESIPVEALQGLGLLRRLYFNNNLIRQVDRESFRELSNLQILHLSNCHITTIDHRAFEGLINLSHLQLNGNKLRQLSGSILDSLMALKQINLHENRWICDCHLRDLQIGLHDRAISQPEQPVCEQPARLSSLPWNSLLLDEFACKPEVSVIEKSIFMEGKNGSITCRVQSIPPSNVTWYFESNLISQMVIKNGTYMSFGNQFIVIKETLSGQTLTSRLIITNMMEKDSGSYTCSAANRAGSALSTISVSVLAPMDRLHKDEVMLLRGEERMVGFLLLIVLIFLLISLFACFVFLRHKGSLLAGLAKDQHRVLTNEDTPHHQHPQQQQPQHSHPHQLSSAKDTIVVARSSGNQSSNTFNSTVRLTDNPDRALMDLNSPLHGAGMNDSIMYNSHSSAGSSRKLDNCDNNQPNCHPMNAFNNNKCLPAYRNSNNGNQFTNIVQDTYNSHYNNNHNNDQSTDDVDRTLSSSSLSKPIAQSSINHNWINNVAYLPRDARSFPRMGRRFSDSSAFPSTLHTATGRAPVVIRESISEEEEPLNDQWKYRRRSEDVISYHTFVHPGNLVLFDRNLLPENPVEHQAFLPDERIQSGLLRYDLPYHNGEQNNTFLSQKDMSTNDQQIPVMMKKPGKNVNFRLDHGNDQSEKELILSSGYGEVSDSSGVKMYRYPPVNETDIMD
ncbi:uncharacterized protein LOC141854302 [Brevipalpus obovatus]|uniref:uncharacterized protein LOC141854302 n=1 Tax=Brevipalpus obovatus TaxID=246614 RepID=UPI003D9F2649